MEKQGFHKWAWLIILLLGGLLAHAGEDVSYTIAFYIGTLIMIFALLTIGIQFKNLKSKKVKKCKIK